MLLYIFFCYVDWKSVLSSKQKKLFWDSDFPYIKVAPDVCVYECHRGADHDADRKNRRKQKNVNRNFFHPPNNT